MSLKADRALSKLNFHFHSKSKTNLVIFRKYNLYLQYYKIDLSFSIKLQNINLNVYEKYLYKTKRKAERLNISERKARDENVLAKRADFS